jgi:hypothetical protein
VDEPCFRHLNERSERKFPGLKNPGMYNSRHAINVIRVQLMFRSVLERIRARRQAKPKPELPSNVATPAISAPVTSPLSINEQPRPVSREHNTEQDQDRGAEATSSSARNTVG